MHSWLRAAARVTGLAAVAALLFSAGCASSRDGGDPALGATSGHESNAAPEPDEHLTGDALAASVEESYVIGPAASRDLGYRVDWQYPSSGSPIKMVVVEGDSVFTLDERNFLTRLRLEQGDRVWRIPIAASVERIFGVTYIPEAERLYVTAGGELFVLDAASGSRLSKQKLTKTANTAPVRFGNFLLYGSRDGQLVWHAPTLGTTWRAYQISRSIQLAPAVDGGLVVAVGNDGRIMSLQAGNATQVWSRRVLDSIVAPPAVGNGAVYVASLDQHVRGYELSFSRSPLWEYLTESPLTDGPVLIQDRVYQQVPTEGVVCLEALPLDSPGGVVVWRAKGSGGNVVTLLGRSLLAWDDDKKAIDVIDVGFGAVIKSLPMPQMASIIATGPEGGDLYVTGTDGRIERLVPR